MIFFIFRSLFTEISHLNKNDISHSDPVYSDMGIVCIKFIAVDNKFKVYDLNSLINNDFQCL